MSVQTNPKPNTIASQIRPSCPKCRTVMMLARVTPNVPGIDEVTYDCRVCNIKETVLVKR